MKVLDRKHATLLIILSFFTYSVAYLGRYSYAANIPSIMEALGTAKSETGLVSSFFFFTYASGQLANVILSKFYNAKWVVTTALVVSSLCNLTMGLLPGIGGMQYVWLVNGIAQSTLWCNILNTQARFLCKKDIARGIIWNCATLSLGTFLSYGLSALLVELGVSYRVLFYIASGALFVFAFLWFTGYRISEKAIAGNGSILVAEEAPVQADKKKVSHAPFTKFVIFTLLFICISASVAAFTRDGIVTWLPTLLIEDFGLPNSLSIILTMILPEVSLLGVIIVKFLSKKIKAYLHVEALFFMIAALSMILSTVLYPKRLTVLTIVLFAVMYLMISGSINIVTTVLPFAFKKYSNVGSMSAFFDSCCYVGSIISTYALGALAENFSWSAVMILITTLSVVGLAVTVCASVFAKKTEIQNDVF